MTEQVSDSQASNSEDPVQDGRAPWQIPAVTYAIEPEDVANYFESGLDSNPHYSSSANLVS